MGEEVEAGQVRKGEVWGVEGGEQGGEDGGVWREEEGVQVYGEEGELG